MRVVFEKNKKQMVRGAFKNDSYWQCWSVNRKAFKNEAVDTVLQRWSVQKCLTVDILLTSYYFHISSFLLYIFFIVISYQR